MRSVYLEPTESSVKNKNARRKHQDRPAQGFGPVNNAVSQMNAVPQEEVKKIAARQLDPPLHLALAEVAYSKRYPEGLSVIVEGNYGGRNKRWT